MKQVIHGSIPIDVIRKITGRDLQLPPNTEFKLIVKDKSAVFNTGPTPIGAIGVMKRIVALLDKEELPYEELIQIAVDYDKRVVMTLVS